MINAICVNTE